VSQCWTLIILIRDRATGRIVDVIVGPTSCFDYGDGPAREGYGEGQHVPQKVKTPPFLECVQRADNELRNRLGQINDRWKAGDLLPDSTDMLNGVLWSAIGALGMQKYGGWGAAAAGFVFGIGSQGSGNAMHVSRQIGKDKAKAFGKCENAVNQCQKYLGEKK
jgi:hypothetical protein